jgi:hypothetical protein
MGAKRDKTDDYPYEECKHCKTLTDCPYVEVALDGLGSPLPPANCPKPIEVMKATLKIKKQRNIADPN